MLRHPAPPDLQHLLMPSLLASLKSLPRPAWILFGGTFLNRFGTFVMPFLAIYMTRNGFKWIYGRNPAALWWTCAILGVTGGLLALVRTK